MTPGATAIYCGGMCASAIWPRNLRPMQMPSEALSLTLLTGVKRNEFFMMCVTGNKAVWVLRRIHEGKARFVFLSLWDSYEAIKAFAGEEYEKAVYYPEDIKFLLYLDPQVTHYEVLVSPDNGA